MHPENGGLRHQHIIKMRPAVQKPSSLWLHLEIFSLNSTNWAKFNSVLSSVIQKHKNLQIKFPSLSMSIDKYKLDNHDLFRNFARAKIWHPPPPPPLMNWTKAIKLFLNQTICNWLKLPFQNLGADFHRGAEHWNLLSFAACRIPTLVYHFQSVIPSYFRYNNRANWNAPKKRYCKKKKKRKKQTASISHTSMMHSFGCVSCIWAW